MDLDQNLLRLQGALGNFAVTTPDVQKLEMLSALFQNVDETAKTKMLFLMILNTKMTTTDMLIRDLDSNVVRESTRNLDFPALSYLIFNLNLVGNLSAIVSNTPAALTVEVLSGVFAYAESRILLRGLNKVIIGLFEKILKISKGIHKELGYSCNLWQFMNIFGDMLWCSSTFEHEELLEEDMNNILGTCLICVELYQETLPLPYDRAYELRDLRDKLNPDEACAVEPADCRVKFLKYITKLFDLFDDIFNTCFKYDPIESHTDVAEDAFMLYEKLKNSNIEPSNLSVLDEIKKKPENEYEKMAKSDIETIIDAILSSSTPENWLRTLINLPCFTETEEAVVFVTEYLHILELNDFINITEVVYDHFKRNSDSAVVKDLYLACLDMMPLMHLIYQLENYFALNRRPNLEKSGFDDELTEFFNKMLVRDTFIKSRIVIFCIRSPIKTIKKICEHAIFNTDQINYCTTDLKMLRAACLWEEQPELDIISSVLCDIIDRNLDYGPGERSGLIALIQRLQRSDSLKINIERFVLNMIHKEHSLANYDKMEFALQILRVSIRANTVRSNQVVLLAFLSQLLNQTSWTCSSFAAKRVRARDMLISNIHTILNNWNYSVNDAGLLWLRNEIMKTGDINRIHFCELWYSYGIELATPNDLYMQLFVLIHTRTRLNSTIDFMAKSFQSQKLLTLRISFTAAFIQILPIITYRGWMILMTRVKAVIISWLDLQKEKSDIDVNLVLFRIVTMALYSLAQDMNRNQDMTLCFTYCLRNFGRIIQDNFLTNEGLKYDIAVVFVEELLFLLNGVEDLDLRKEISILLSPVIFGIVNLAKKNMTGEGNKIADLENWYRKKFIGDAGTQ